MSQFLPSINELSCTDRIMKHTLPAPTRSNGPGERTDQIKLTPQQTFAMVNAKTRQLHIARNRCRCPGTEGHSTHPFKELVSLTSLLFAAAINTLLVILSSSICCRHQHLPSHTLLIHSTNESQPLQDSLIYFTRKLFFHISYNTHLFISNSVYLFHSF